MRDFLKQYVNYLKKEGKIAFNDLKSIKTIYKQIPNLLTISRLIATIPINLFFFAGNIPASLITCGIAAFTDLIDGKFARKYNVESKFGADLDAICDKLFILLMAIPIVIQNPFMLTNIGLEAGIIATNFNARKDGKEVESKMIGKVKTWFLSATVLLGYLFPILNINPSLLTSFLITIPAATFQTATLINYVNINHQNKISEKQNVIISETTKITIEEPKKEKTKDMTLVTPATINELKKERERLLHNEEELGYQKKKTNLK